ncbi:MAG: tRNA 2-selenouridine(34) synthase MnmH [Pseudomonadota bacterium]|nr:tRNA 2-selenouridine(34) synthase MnmH [Pseudomonadota bacterium]
MIEPFEDLGPRTLALFDDIIDVRSPGEFAEDHLPGAINLPVLNDAERAEVGTIYVQSSRFLARRVGAAIVARNVASHLDGPLADKPPGYRPLLYCWRGGMRSNAMATILSQIGWRVGVVTGGYKTWRRAVVKGLREGDAHLNLILLDGQTGTAKSALLGRLAALGVQTLDLEALAAHRGSVFGALPGTAQPPQKLFESELWSRLSRFEVERPVLVEAESARIGALVLPRNLWRSMLVAPRVVLSADIGSRAAFLVDAYEDLLRDPGEVLASIERLAPFHSKERLEEWRELAGARQYRAVAGRLMREHYDPLYDRSRKRRSDAPLGTVGVKGFDRAGLDETACEIKALIDVR